MIDWLPIVANAVTIAAVGFGLWRAQDRRLSNIESNFRTLVAYLKGRDLIPLDAKFDE